MTKIAFIGGGEIGSALSSLVLPESLLGSIDKDPARTTLKGPEVLGEADIIVMCVPTQYLREALTEYRASFKPGAAVISVSKGVDSSGKMVHEICHELLGERPWGLLYGPMIAEDLKKGEPTTAFVVSAERSVFDQLCSALSGQIALNYSAEVEAAALLGLLKNIYAIGLGILSGQNYGNNTAASFVIHALKEMELILKKEGLSLSLVSDAVGLGDLLATGYSENSKNRTVGVNLALSQKAGSSEGMLALENLPPVIRGCLDDCPILAALLYSVSGPVSEDTLTNAIFN